MSSITFGNRFDKGTIELTPEELYCIHELLENSINDLFKRIETDKEALDDILTSEVNLIKKIERVCTPTSHDYNGNEWIKEKDHNKRLCVYLSVMDKGVNRWIKEHEVQ